MSDSVFFSRKIIKDSSEIHIPPTISSILAYSPQQLTRNDWRNNCGGPVKSVSWNLGQNAKKYHVTARLWSSSFVRSVYRRMPLRTRSGIRGPTMSELL